MQTTYQVTCKCGHIFPIPGKFLSTDEDERAALIKALEGLLCPDCIQAAIDELHTLREHFLKIGAVSPDITEEKWRTLARDARRDILRENIIPPLPPKSPDISDEIMRYPPPPELLDVTDSRGEPYPPIPKETYAILHAIDAWNRDYPVGTDVLVTPSGEEPPGNLIPYHTYRTNSPARLLAGKPVVEVKGLGPIELARLVPIVT